MGKKLTIEFVREKFKREEWKLFSKEYVNNHTKLECVCPNGHSGSITWNDWQQGRRCSECSGIRKRTIEFIKSAFEKEKYICISKEYINNRTHLNYICPEGHLGSITWANWQRGRRCPTCASINRFGKGHWNWQGGISKEPYCQDWSKNLKEYIKERDDYKCLNPYCNSKNQNDLSIHHIDYNKKSCGPENLITICRSCNFRANTDREWHQSWYQAILNKRYNGTMT